LNGSEKQVNLIVIHMLIRAGNKYTLML